MEAPPGPEPMELDAPPPPAAVAAAAATAGISEKKKEEGGGDAVTGHIISTTIGGKNGEPKRVSFFRGLFGFCSSLCTVECASFGALRLLPCS